MKKYIFPYLRLSLILSSHVFTLSLTTQASSINFDSYEMQSILTYLNGLADGNLGSATEQLPTFFKDGKSVNPNRATTIQGGFQRIYKRLVANENLIDQQKQQIKMLEKGGGQGGPAVQSDTKKLTKFIKDLQKGDVDSVKNSIPEPLKKDNDLIDAFKNLNSVIQSNFTLQEELNKLKKGQGISSDYVSPEDLKKNYTSNQDIGRNYLSRQELNEKYILKTNAQNEVDGSKYILKETVQTDYISKEDLKEKYILKKDAQNQVNGDKYILKTEVDKQYIKKSEAKNQWKLPALIAIVVALGSLCLNAFLGFAYMQQNGQ